MITDSVHALVAAALDVAAADGVVSIQERPEITFERPKRREHGDLATNVAMVVSRGQSSPREVAAALIERLPPSHLIESVDVAGPGFLNFHLSSAWLHDVVRRAADRTSGFGRQLVGARAKVNVEFVSANPTGPLNIVSGRHAAVGDALASLLEAIGCEVTREYYFNDAGTQVVTFARSIAHHYMKQFGHDVAFPEAGYTGDDVAALALEIAEEEGESLTLLPEEERIEKLRAICADKVMRQTHATLERFGTHFDVFFQERDLYESDAIEEGLSELHTRGHTEERDGATWFLSSRFGDDKDRVLVRSDGRPTYLAADVAYMRNKFERGFERLLYVLGPDHHGTIARMRALAEALGHDRDAVEIPIVQLVSIARGGEALKGSKRAGIYVKLDDLIDEVGVDAARYIFLTRSIDAPLEFDIELAKEQAPENPVFYVQYAHARMSSILRKAREQGISDEVSSAPLELLDHPSEDELMRKLEAYEEEVLEAAQRRAPQRMSRYVEELASTFSAFYRDCQVVSEDAELSHARLTLCRATSRVVADGLALLGVGAPEQM